MATLKDIVKERDKDMLDKTNVGGVYGCPDWYRYLHPYLEEIETRQHKCPKVVSELKPPARCKACWNREVEE
jgi:hypothetical protein